MNIIISNSSQEPIYEQVVKSIENAILKDELKQGDALPSVRVMANDLKISFLTVKKAYDILEQSGFIKTVQGKGSFVLTRNMDLLREESLKKIQNNIENIISISKYSDIKEEEVIELFKMMYEGEI